LQTWTACPGQMRELLCMCQEVIMVAQLPTFVACLKAREHIE